MGGPHQSESRLFILAEMLKGRKLRIVDALMTCPDDRVRKAREYYVGGIKVNARAAIHIIKTGLANITGSKRDRRYEITSEGRKFYSRWGGRK